MPIQNEKIIVFDDDGNPKELRYYEAEKLVARLGTILDTDGNFIGLRELNIESVSPQSWFERNVLKKQPQKRIDVLTLDFVGLINWINTIKTIKNVDDLENLWNLWNLWNLANVENIENIQNIHSASVSLNPIRNPEFKGGWSHWYRATTPDAFSIVTDDEYFGYCVKINNSTGNLIQYLAHVDSNKYNRFAFWAYKETVGGANLKFWIGYSDGTTTYGIQTITSTWAQYVIPLTANKTISSIQFVDNTGICYITRCNLIESNIISGTVAVSGLPALVASNVALGLGESATYATLRVDTATSGQATLLAAQGAEVKIHVCGYQLQAKGDVEVSLRSASTDISPEWDLNAREGAVCPPVPKPLGYFATVANELLSINLDAAIRVTGNIQYWLGA